MQTAIINYYPPVIRDIKEIQQIARAEDKEFDKLKSIAGNVANNMFISSADEAGVSRFEKMLGIMPAKSQTLGERKLFILSQMRQGKISLGKLQDMLQEYSKGIRLLSHMEECELEVITGEDTVNGDVLYKIVDEILPLDICFDVSRELCAGIFVMAGITTEIHANIGWRG